MLRQSRPKVFAVVLSSPPLVLANPLTQSTESYHTFPVLSSLIVANGTVTLNNELKRTVTTLSVAAVFIVAVTYLILIKYAGHLISTSKLPFAALGANISAILEAT